MAGQNGHFGRYAPEKIPYAIDRYNKEVNRLYGVLDRRLDGRAFLAGDDYSIADMASYPWIVPWQVHQQNLDAFVNLKRWFSGNRRASGDRARVRARERVSELTGSSTSRAARFSSARPRTPARIHGSAAR